MISFQPKILYCRDCDLFSDSWVDRGGRGCKYGCHGGPRGTTIQVGVCSRTGKTKLENSAACRFLEPVGQGKQRFLFVRKRGLSDG